MNLVELDHALRKLRLSGMAAVLETRLRQVTLPGAGRAEKEHVFALCDEARGRQLVDERPIHLLVEIEIEGIEGAVRITEARLFVPPLEEPVLSAQELVGDEHRHEIDRCELLGLGMP